MPPARIFPTTDSVLPMLTAFYGSSVLAITFYGGIFSTLPAYIADLFGQKHTGAIHGKLLTAWAASAVVGPMGLAYLRNQSISNAIQDLLHRVWTMPQRSNMPLVAPWKTRCNPVFD